VPQWFRALSSGERRTFWACFGGWAVDAMDVQMYAVALPTLISLWSLSKTQAGALGTVALLVSSVGGWIAGIMADRMGRVRVLKIMIVWFSAFTFLSGFASSFGEFLAARSMQGLGFGGEWAAGAVLIAETVPARFRGKAVAAVQSGWSVGYGAAVLVFTLLFNLLPPEVAWRGLFFVSVIPGLMVLWICQGIKEPDVYRQSRQIALAARGKEPFWAIFHPQLIRRTGFAALLTMGILGGNFTVLTWLPTYLNVVRHLTYTNTGLFLVVNIAGSFIGYILGGYCSDAIGRRRAFFLFAVLATLTVVAYTQLATSAVAILVLGFPLGFFQSAMNAGVGAFLAELFPTRLRGTAQGFTYNAGRGIGALFPTLVGLGSDSLGLGLAVCIAAAAAYSLVGMASLMLPETRGKVLEATS
jgi:MFS family permease